jgi:hypothetical protein
MKKQIESEKVWFVVGMIFFIATFPLSDLFSIGSLVLGFACTVVAYYIAMKKHYEAFYELYIELGVPWKAGFTSRWNIKRIVIVCASVFFVAIILALIVNKFFWIGLLLTIAMVDVWLFICVFSYRCVDKYLERKYSKKFNQNE